MTEERFAINHQCEIFHKVRYDIIMLRNERQFANLTGMNWLQSPYAEILMQNHIKTCSGGKEGRM